MRFLHLYAFLFLISGISTQAQTWAWARQATSTTFSQTANKVRADNEGNVYLLAHSSGTAAFGQWQVNAGNYIAKYKADGQIDWVMQVPLLSDIYPGNNGNLHIAGTFTGQL